MAWFWNWLNSLVDDVYDYFVVTLHCDAFVLPERSPYMTYYCNGIDLEQHGE